MLKIIFVLKDFINYTPAVCTFPTRSLQNSRVNVGNEHNYFHR